MCIFNCVYRPSLFRCVRCGSFWGFIFHFCEIFIKLQMWYNLISGHVLCDFQMATVTTKTEITAREGWKSLSIYLPVILHNLRRSKHGTRLLPHIHIYVFKRPSVWTENQWPPASSGHHKDRIWRSQLLILSRLTWRHGFYPRHISMQLRLTEK